MILIENRKIEKIIAYVNLLKHLKEIGKVLFPKPRILIVKQPFKIWHMRDPPK